MNFKSVVLCLMLLVESAIAQVDHSLFDDVLKKHVVNGAVDYAAIKKDGRLEKYTKQISTREPATIKDSHDRLAFWINAYNAYTIKLILDNYPVTSIRDIKKGDTGPWDIVWIDIHDRQYSLNQIEHEIIRKEFDEPRIHMALVCAAVSCPPLRSEAYIGKTLDRQLSDNSKIFLSDKSKNRYDQSTNVLYLSELFSWYGKDFVSAYGSAEAFALKMLGVNPETSPQIKYLSYDWSLNLKR